MSFPFSFENLRFLETDSALADFVIIHIGTLATGDRKRQNREKLTSKGSGKVRFRGK